MKKEFHFVVILLTVSVLTFPFMGFSQNSSLLMREGDALWEERVEAGKAEAAISSYKKVLEVELESYEAFWKIARACFYLGDLLPETGEMRDQHREMGEEGMTYARRALELNPEGVEGHYYYVLSIAQYSIGISIIKALTMGLGSDYEEHIGKALEINKNYDSAGPLRAMGRYWYRLPWIKRDVKKSIRYLKEAVVSAPANVRGHLYLAESYLKAGEKEPAKAHLQKALEIVPDLNKEVDAKRWKERAGMLLKEKF